MILGALGLAVLLSITLAITIGPVYISPVTVWHIIASHVLGVSPGDWTAGQDHIVWLIRLPRVLLAGIVGAGLAVVGATMQATVRNPLADPYLLGTSSGASVGAVLVIMLGINFLAPYSLSILAFAGAVGSFVIVFAMAQTGGRVSPTRLILAGVATAYVLSAITSLILFLGDERAVRAVLFWMLGTLSGAKWSYLGLPAAALLVGISFLVLKYRAMNALLAGRRDGHHPRSEHPGPAAPAPPADGPAHRRHGGGIRRRRLRGVDDAPHRAAGLGRRPPPGASRQRPRRGHLPHLG